MNVTLVYWLIIIHLLSDFYFQTENMSQKKKTEYKFLIGHIVIMGFISLGILVLYGFEKWLTYAVLVNFGVHTIIDILKMYVPKNISRKIEYFIDQLMRFLTMVILGFIFSGTELIYGVGGYLAEYHKYLPIVIAFLLILKPSNVTFSVLFKSFKPESIDDFEKNTEENQSVGKWIGALERIIILILFLMNSIGSVALIIAAKTLTRYDKITKEPKFAEYYLLGTLYSLAFAFAVALLLLR